jgi:chromate reductase, NAD(P)H dehydrogenase (quinone)
MRHTRPKSHVRLLFITGSTRRRSANTAAVHTARELLGAEAAAVYDDLCELPPFERGKKPAARVVDLHEALARADAVVFCTPEYGGRLPESLRNLLDWTAGAKVMRGKPATWLNVSGLADGEGADAALRAVLRSAGASIMTSSGIRVPVSHEDVGPDGLIANPTTLNRLGHALATIATELAAASRTLIPRRSNALL